MLTGQLGQFIFMICQPDICQHVADMQTCLGDMSFGGSWQHDTALTFPTKFFKVYSDLAGDEKISRPLAQKKSLHCYIIVQQGASKFELT